MSLTLNESHEIGYFSFKFDHHLRACTTSGKRCRYCMQNSQRKNIGDQLLTKSPIGLKDNSIRDQKSMPILLTEILECRVQDD
jgi:hypothetical protein